MKKSTVGFSLVELLVTISIIGILSAIVYVNFSDGGKQSRDAKRQADLRLLQSAVELYKNEHGRYPEGCRGAGNWSGQEGSGASLECTSGSQYIVDLAPKYIPALPVDPKLNGSGSGYRYTVDADGMVYKIMAENTVESESVTFNHPFSRCGNAGDSSSECINTPSSPTASCTGGYNNCGSQLSQCMTADSNNYAVSGGYAKGGMWGTTYRSTDVAKEYFSDIIKCK